MGDEFLDRERERLDILSGSADYGEGINGLMVAEFTRKALSHLPDSNCRILELGPAEGISTQTIVASFAGVLEVVEGSKTLAEMVQKSNPKAVVHNCLFEEFSPNGKFDFILMSHVLEHVDKPVELLRRVSEWLSTNGVIVIGVPNANSLHRELAVIMGILKHSAELGESDLKVGHRRVYDHETLEMQVNQAGLRITHLEGFWLKLFTNAQLASLSIPGILEGCFELGSRHPLQAAEILAVVQKIPGDRDPESRLN
jgi:2-polyprenyl-3-methyl-5-hydroxy-6-metoxy-1,4-benzoquinol methylase